MLQKKGAGRAFLSKLGDLEFFYMKYKGLHRLMPTRD